MKRWTWKIEVDDPMSSQLQPLEITVKGDRYSDGRSRAQAVVQDIYPVSDDVKIDAWLRAVEEV